MRKWWLVYAVCIGAFALYVLDYYGRNRSEGWEDAAGLRGDPEEKYVMVTFQAGIDYWKNCLKGFEDAAQSLGVSVEYHGATQYDVNEQIMVLERVVARKPAGIAVSAIHPDRLTPTIDKAVEYGIPVVLFDSGAPGSKAYSFLATDNYRAGAIAARKMAELTGGRGEVAVITSPNQQNHMERTRGFRETIEAEFPDMRVVAVKNGKGDAFASRQAAMEAMGEFPDLAGIFATEANGGVGVGDAVRLMQRTGRVKIIGFDTDKATLDMVKDGTIAATLAQGTWKMGYWSLMFLFHLRHADPQSGTPMFPHSVEPLVPPYVDTGVTVVTRDNVDRFYAK
ncbi:MAG: LacI family transcriptional regulator [Candidatus Reconcilbacillus cellulovorans]|uniref:LacI family transcriptional regulator n=1 Tax=Candidatus Reconcilbacillus cellulovorans TaxID=1906605 RepID=A0A2A6E174_9BACL|nr:MAG: LacI family transcriptional regulator [Candidatus Reconcilbacillus cellulovorans]